MNTFVVAVTITILAMSETGFAQCPSTQNPPGYWGDGTGDVEIICGTTGTISGEAQGLNMIRGQSRHITTLPVGTTNFEITMYATSDVDTLLMRSCSNGNCPTSGGGLSGGPNYGQCIAGYRCENYCRWSPSGCTRNNYGGSWSFSGDCVSGCYSGTYHVREWVNIPEVTSQMGVLEHYVYAYNSFAGYVT